MTDAELQRKLNKLAALATELDAEAKRRYGPNGFLFHEADSGFHIMADDCSGMPAARQQFIRASSRGPCRMGAGAW